MYDVAITTSSYHFRFARAGLLPMIIVPGPGAALYRGLGTVIAGGMLVNTVFMLVLLPALLRLGEPAAERSATRPADGPIEEGAV